MRIALVNGIFHKKRISEPMGLCFLAAVLRAEGWAVEILEPRLEGLGVAETAARLLDALPDIIGISTFSFQFKEVQDLISQLRERQYKGLLMMGGLGASLCADAWLSKCPGLNLIVVGEGEETAVEVVRALHAERLGQQPAGSWRRVPGIAYRETTGIIRRTPSRRRIANLDTIPFMARDILDRNITKYGRDFTSVPIMSSRGCYRNCSYCWIAAAMNLQKGARYRQRSVKNVIDEMEHIVSRYQVHRFSFEDDNFILPGKAGAERVRKFRSEIARRGLKIEFFMQTRPDTISAEVVQDLRQAGMTKLFIGIEAIAEEDINLYKKGTKVEDIENVLMMLKNCGYEADVGREEHDRLRFGYICFHPLTTVASVRKSLALFRKFGLTPKRLVTKVNLFDGDMDIKKVFAEHGCIVEEGKEYPFCDPRVGTIYRGLKSFADEAFGYREPIRSVEKHVARLCRDKRSIQSLSACRKELDKMVLDVLEDLVTVAENQFSNSCDFERRATMKIEESKQKLHAYADNLHLNDAISKACEKYGAERDMHDTYW